MPWYRPARFTAAALFVVLAHLTAPMRPASADAAWSDLTQRIEASERGNVVLGAEPPGFHFPLDARPALAVLGSTWRTAVPGGEPYSVRVFYVPSARTAEAVAALVAKLQAAGYSEMAASYFPEAFGGDRRAGRTWCPAERERSSVTLTVGSPNGVPALDVSVAGACGSHSLAQWPAEARVPLLADIPGLQIFLRVRSTGGAETSLGSFAVIRSALPATTVAAKLAERFTAAGWIARAPVADGTTVLQHFARVDGSRQWNALVVLVPRADRVTLFDVALDVTRDPVDSAAP